MLEFKRLDWCERAFGEVEFFSGTKHQTEIHNSNAVLGDRYLCQVSPEKA
jgi:hypothetical protein